MDVEGEDNMTEGIFGKIGGDIEKGNKDEFGIMVSGCNNGGKIK